MRPADAKRTLGFTEKPRQSAKSATFCKGSVDPTFQTATVPPAYVYRVLLLDSDAAHAARLITEVLHPQHLTVNHVRSLEEAIVKLQHHTLYYALVVINVSANGPPWLKVLQNLQHACQRVNGQTASLFLCVSETPKEAEFILRIEQTGARYAQQ
jgi:CheY-like chemotaxis protein